MIQPDFLHKYPKEYEITNFHHHLEYLLLFSRHFRLKKDDDSDISWRFIHRPRHSMSSCTIEINQMYVNITYIEFLKMYLKSIWDSHIIWSNYSDLTRPHPKWWFSKGNPLISGKSSLANYYSIWPDIMPPYHKQILGKSSLRTKKGTFCSVDGIYLRQPVVKVAKPFKPLGS